ncbi:hypothetical protein BC332_32297 [Capsicum chinense]|nr:hypothetical protein BC332_32297 [Capsicum chinense]
MMMDSMDPFRNSKKSMVKMVEENQGIETSSILEVGSSSKSDNSSSKGFKFVSLSDSSIVMMDSMDPLGNSKKSVDEIVESKQEPKTSSLLQVLLKSDGLDFVPFNDSSVIALMDSMNPYEDFKKSMKEILEANQKIKDCEKCLDELLI